MFAPVETPRLALRLVAFADAEAVHSYASDVVTTRYMGWPRHESLEHTKDALRYFIDAASRGQDCMVGIWRREDGLLLGTTGWGFESPELGVTGWILRKEAQGLGYAKEAMQALMDAVFQAYPHLKALEATIHPGNTASEKLAERLGMAFTGETRQLLAPNLDGLEHLLKVYRIER